MFAQSHAVKCVTTEITIIEQVEVELWRFIVLFLDVPVVKLKNKRSASALLSLTHSISISHSCYKSINKNKKKKHRNLVGFFFPSSPGVVEAVKPFDRLFGNGETKEETLHDISTTRSNWKKVDGTRWNPKKLQETRSNHSIAILLTPLGFRLPFKKKKKKKKNAK